MKGRMEGGVNKRREKEWTEGFKERNLVEVRHEEVREGRKASRDNTGKESVRV